MANPNNQPQAPKIRLTNFEDLSGIRPFADVFIVDGLMKLVFTPTGAQQNQPLAPGPEIAQLPLDSTFTNDSTQTSVLDELGYSILQPKATEVVGKDVERTLTIGNNAANYQALSQYSDVGRFLLNFAGNFASELADPFQKVETYQDIDTPANDYSEWVAGLGAQGYLRVTDRTTGTPRAEYFNGTVWAQFTPGGVVDWSLTQGNGTQDATLDFRSLTTGITQVIGGVTVIVDTYQGRESTDNAIYRQRQVARFLGSDNGTQIESGFITGTTEPFFSLIGVRSGTDYPMIRANMSGLDVQLGFFGVAPVARPAVTAAGVTAADLLTALNSIGILQSV
jgi:hypothetical protein